MQTFAEQLTAARSAAHMTQEQLSNTINVSRQTISSWERGRTQPDVETIRLLSQVLNYTFDISAPVEETTPEAAPQKAAPEAVSSEAQTAPRKRKRLWLAIGAAAVIVACAAIILIPKLTRKPTPEDQHDTFSVEYYQQETPNEPEKAYLTFDNRAWDEKGDYDTFQRYSFTMYETNGIGFDVERVELQAQGITKVRTATYGPNDLRADNKNPEIVPYGSLLFDGGFPKGNFSRVGIAVYGNDANGEPLVFYSLIEF
ncbi:MAG: helix-turn-helix transcriptional regulator [Clostridiales bacterium]|nr:helix-turn-helix transcriptional regulator [Clostridiales bacterium]